MSEQDCGQTVSERYSTDALVYRDLWAPLLRPHGQELLASLPLSTASRIVDVGSGCGSLLPDIRSRAPGAFAIAIDRAPGMLAAVSAEISRAMMDAAQLGLASASMDVAIFAFVLFHTTDPQEVLIESRRILRSGGTVGTTTWDGDPRFPAQRAWLEELDSCGATSAPPQMMSNHDPVATPERMHDLLRRAGFRSINTWKHPFGHPYSLEEFIAVRTRLGWSKRRVDSLAPDSRTSFLRRARLRLEKMDRSDFVDDAEIVFATAVAP